jgi:hypothetical protein
MAQGSHDDCFLAISKLHQPISKAPEMLALRRYRKVICSTCSRVYSQAQ